MTANTTEVPTAELAERLALDLADARLAILELANACERLIVGNARVWKGKEASAMLASIDNARALATPDDDPDGAPTVAGDGTTAYAMERSPELPRYWIDTPGGDGREFFRLQDVVNEYQRGRVRNAYDRQTRTLFIYSGTWLSDPPAIAEAA